MATLNRFRTSEANPTIFSDKQSIFIRDDSDESYQAEEEDMTEVSDHLKINE